MSAMDRDEFLVWVKSSLYEAELALHNGDPAPRRALCSSVSPSVSSVRGATPTPKLRSCAVPLCRDEILKLHLLRVRGAVVRRH